MVNLGALSTSPLAFALGAYAAQPHSQPFTYRSGITYNGLLESIREWILTDLVPFLEENTGQQQWDDNADILSARVNAALNAQATEVNTNLNDAIDQVIHAHILVTDPIVDQVVSLQGGQARGVLDYLYKLSDEKLLPFFNNTNMGNPNAQVRALLDQMYKITSYKIREAVDVDNSYFRDYMDDRYAQGPSGGFALGWGGDSNARIGDNGGSNGWWQGIDKGRVGNGRLAFGSNAIWGGSVLTGLNQVGNLDLTTVTVDGVYEPNDSSPKRRVTFLPLTSNEMRAYIDRGNGFEVINVLPNPPQSSTMRISLRGFVQ